MTFYQCLLFGKAGDRSGKFKISLTHSVRQSSSRVVFRDGKTFIAGNAARNSSLIPLLFSMSHRSDTFAHNSGCARSGSVLDFFPAQYWLRKVNTQNGL